MNRNNDTPRIPTLVADAGRASATTLNGGESDAPVDHDPTLKWIISDLAEAGEKTPAPLTVLARKQTPPPLQHSRPWRSDMRSLRSSPNPIDRPAGVRNSSRHL